MESRWWKTKNILILCKIKMHINAIYRVCKILHIEKQQAAFNRLPSKDFRNKF